MSRGFSVSKISAASVILAASTIELAIVAGIISATHPSVQSVAALFSGPELNKSREAGPHQIEAGSVADAVEAANKAVFSLRVKYRTAAGGMGDGAPLDQFADPRTRSIPEGQRRVRTSQGSGFFISADGYAVTNRHVTAGSDSVELITGDQKTAVCWLQSHSPTDQPRRSASRRAT
jgi:serine protease Do